ncbi:MAG: zf-HC2 domain-containing protein [Nitriliruptoraceae bacterium]
MSEAHTRYESLAVGHVLGGLRPEQAREFRQHLRSCEGCRARVTELEQIATELAAAEREERAQRALAAEDDGPPEHLEDRPVAGGIGVPQVTAAVLVVLALAIAMGFWNLHLRTSVTTLTAVAEAQGDALARLASGAALDPDLAPGVSGQVVTDGASVTLALAGLDPLRADERLVAWFEGAPDPEGAPPRVLAGPGELTEGDVAASIETQGATVLRVTREVGTSQRAPQGPQVLEVALVVDRSD